MVRFLTIDAATANTTNTTFAHRLDLTDGPFGLREIESVLSFPARNGRSWSISIQTSDVATVIFTILVLTFALDHYFFQSRYLVHVAGARSKKDHATDLNDKASLHENEALNLESGRKCSTDEDVGPDPKSEHQCESPASRPGSGLMHRVIDTLVILFLAGMLGVKGNEETASKRNMEIVESTSTKPEGERETESFAPTSRWGKFVQHPWLQKLSTSAIILLASLAMFLFFAYQILFWPWLMTLFIMLQCFYYVALNDGATIPWQSIALKSTLHLVIWTIIGATLLLRPSRFQGALWKSFRWTHAVTWWLFWAVLESYSLGAFVARRIGFQHSEITMQVLLIIQPVLVVYLYSGIVCNAVIAVRVMKYLWNNSITKT